MSELLQLEVFEIFQDNRIEELQHLYDRVSVSSASLGRTYKRFWGGLIAYCHPQCSSQEEEGNSYNWITGGQCGGATVTYQTMGLSSGQSNLQALEKETKRDTIGIRLEEPPETRLAFYPILHIYLEAKLGITMLILDCTQLSCCT